MAPAITISITTIGGNLNTFLVMFWPYLLVLGVGVLMVLIAFSIAISAILMLAGSRGSRGMTFAEFDADWQGRGSPVSGGARSFDEFDADWKRRGSPVT